MNLKRIFIVVLFMFFFIGQASAGTPHYINGTTYPMIWNGTYASENINYMTYWSTGYDMFWNGGLLQTVWDGVYAYDKIAYPNNGTAISPWAMWHIESYNPTNKKWVETIPISNTFIKIDNSTLKRVMTMGSGEKFNITYHNEGTKIKQDLELSNVLAREYRLTYRIDSVAAQDVNPNTTKFTPGFFNNFTLFDVADVIPYTVNRTLNETTGNWSGDGSYLYGWNTTASISITDRKMYFTLTNGQVMAVGQTTLIDPSWSTNGSTTPAWQSTSKSNVTEDIGDHNIKVGVFADNFNDNNYNGWGVTVGTWTANNGYINVTGVGYPYLYYSFPINSMELLISGKYMFPSSDFTTTIVLSLYNGTNYYYLEKYKSGTFRILKYTGSYSFPVTTSYSQPADTWIKYSMYRNKTGVMQLYINDAPVGSSASETVFQQFDTIKLYADNATASKIAYWDDLRISTSTSGNLTAWHDSGSGNETYQIDVNASGGTNANYSAFYRTNGTGAWTAIGTPNSTANQSITLTTKYQNTDVKVGLYGNSTVTPELTQITFWTQASGEGATYNISGYVNDTLSSPIDAVSVVNDTNSTTTNATGYYNLSAMINGTYNFSYIKTGYVTGYKEITVNGVDVMNQNVTLSERVLPSGDRTLSQINASINTNCEVDQIMYVELQTQITWIYTCSLGSSQENASVGVKHGEGVWINSTTNIDKVRSW